MESIVLNSARSLKEAFLTHLIETILSFLCLSSCFFLFQLLKKSITPELKVVLGCTYIARLPLVKQGWEDLTHCVVNIIAE